MRPGRSAGPLRAQLDDRSTGRRVRLRHRRPGRVRRAVRSSRATARADRARPGKLADADADRDAPKPQATATAARRRRRLRARSGPGCSSPAAAWPGSPSGCSPPRVLSRQGGGMRLLALVARRSRCVAAPARRAGPRRRRSSAAARSTPRRSSSRAATATRSCPASTSTTASSSTPGSSCRSRADTDIDNSGGQRAGRDRTSRATSTRRRARPTSCQPPDGDKSDLGFGLGETEPLVISSDVVAAGRGQRQRAGLAGRGRLLPRAAHASTRATATPPPRRRSRSRSTAEINGHRAAERDADGRPRRRRAAADADGDRRGARPARTTPARPPRSRPSVRRRRDPDRRGRRDRPPPAPSLTGFEFLHKSSGAAGTRRTLEGGADRRPHQSGRHRRHEGGGARARHGVAAGALRAPEGREGGRRRRAGRPAARAQEAPRGRGGLPRGRALGAGGRARRSRRRRSRPTCPPSSRDEELDALVAAAVAETGASSPRDMGRVIKQVMEAAGGRADGKRVSTKVKEALN